MAEILKKRHLTLSSDEGVKEVKIGDEKITEGDYYETTEVTISATIVENDSNYVYTFDGWYNSENICVSSLQEYTFTMPTEDFSLTAKTSSEPIYKLTINVSNGTINGTENSSTITFDVNKGGEWYISNNKITYKEDEETVVAYEITPNSSDYFETPLWDSSYGEITDINTIITAIYYKNSNIELIASDIKHEMDNRTYKDYEIQAECSYTLYMDFWFYYIKDTNDSNDGKVFVNAKINKDSKKVYNYWEWYAFITPEGDENPKEEGWYEKNSSGNYVLTSDTTVDTSKEYYERHLPKEVEDNTWTTYYTLQCVFNNGTTNVIPWKKYWVNENRENEDIWTIIPMSYGGTYSSSTAISVKFLCWTNNNIPNNWITLSNIKSYTLTLETDTGGTVSGAGTYPETDSVTINVTVKEPDDSYVYNFIGWYDKAEETCVSETPEYTFKLTKDTTYYAKIEHIDRYQLTINVANGTIDGTGGKSSIIVPAIKGSIWTTSGNSISCGSTSYTVSPITSDKYTYSGPTWNANSITITDERMSVQATYTPSLILLQYLENQIVDQGYYYNSDYKKHLYYELHMDFWFYYDTSDKKAYVNARINSNSKSDEGFNTKGWSVYYNMQYSFNNGNYGILPYSVYWGGTDGKRYANESWTMIPKEYSVKADTGIAYEESESKGVGFYCWKKWISLSGAGEHGVVLTGDSGVSNITGDGNYFEGDVVSINADIPTDDCSYKYYFSGWKNIDTGDIASMSQDYSFVMPGDDYFASLTTNDIRLNATYTKKTRYQLTINVKNGTINGKTSLTVSVIGNETITPDGNSITCNGVTYTLIPDEDSSYKYSSVPTWNPESITITEEEMSIQATYEKVPAKASMILGTKSIPKCYLAGSLVSKIIYVEKTGDDPTKDYQEYIIYDAS